MRTTRARQAKNAGGYLSSLHIAETKIVAGLGQYGSFVNAL
jgi:hypothetical protein